jgi:hypothetical protein
MKTISQILALIGGLILSIPVHHVTPKIYNNVVQAKDIDPLLSQLKEKYGVEENKAMALLSHIRKLEDQVFPKAEDILAVIAVESRFREDAVSPSGAIGLMQIMYKYHRDKSFSEEELKDPFHNIHVGVTILREYYQNLRDRSATFQAYNIGIGAWRKGLTAEKYVEKVNLERERIDGQ